MTDETTQPAPLEPCPFCGHPGINTTEEERYHAGQPMWSSPSCDRCGMFGPESDASGNRMGLAGQRAAWNALSRRVRCADALYEAIDRLIRENDETACHHLDTEWEGADRTRCRNCGLTWSDDEDAPTYKDTEGVAAARAALEAARVWGG
jgi:hypothetical protein